MTETVKYTKKDFTSDQEVRWCPGCGDYSILAGVQLACTKLGRKKEDVVFVSGIGCSSRFPYYMNTYGYHTIHGRACAVASGLKSAMPHVSMWVITGDGDGLSIGGNHTIHALRRNVDMNIILFNNQIYGLTKGQYSPTSEVGKVTKSTPYGSLDRAFNPGMVAFGAGSTHIARTHDKDPKHLQETMLEAETHRGASFIEALQNCNIFNDHAHDLFTERKTREDNAIYAKAGEPLVYGKEIRKGLVVEDMQLKVVEIGDKYKEEDCVVHDPTNRNLAYLLLDSDRRDGFPKIFGTIWIDKNESHAYDKQINDQLEDVKKKKGEGDFTKLLHSGDTWEID
jgi:2-oxoglutarate ferredoxin oxidoreductase subunit beta